MENTVETTKNVRENSRDFSRKCTINIEKILRGTFKNHCRYLSRKNFESTVEKFERISIRKMCEVEFWGKCRQNFVENSRNL